MRTALADAITEQLVETGPSRLASFQTVLHPAVEQLLTTEVFQSIFRTAIISAQDAILTEEGNSAAINLSAALGVLSGSLQVSNPDLADSTPTGADAFLVNVSSTLRSAQPWKIAKSSGEANLRSLAILAVLVAAIVLLEPDRRRGVLKVGIGITLAGSTRTEAQELRCNGHAELCDRRLDDSTKSPSPPPITRCRPGAIRDGCSPSTTKGSPPSFPMASVRC